MTNQTEHQPDLLHGLTEIGAHMGLTKRQAMHIADSTDLPTFKLGKSVCALRSQIDAWLLSKSKGGRDE